MASRSGGRSVRARLREAGAPALAVAAAVILLAGCGSISLTPEPATPTDFPGLTGRLNAAKIKVSDWVSGDAGCADPDLVPASISFKAAGLDQAEPVKLYLYIFRNKDAYDRHFAQVGPCAKSWVTDAATYEEIEQSPYVVAGQGPWGPEFEKTLRATIQAAAGTGG